MDRNVMMAYTEVDKIISLMDVEFQRKIPEKIRKIISENRLSNYNVIINPNIPLKEQNISKKALSILAVLNYNYWIIGEKRKEELIEKYRINEIVKQKKLREQYNPNNIFNNRRSSSDNLKNESKQLMIYNKKEKFFIKIISKIKKMLKIDTF